VLQQGEIQRVGGTETLRVDVRIIAATNKDLEAMVKAKTFREDLYYRLNVVRIKMPPLRDRRDDIPQLVDFCLHNLVKQKKARVAKVSPEAMAVLVRYDWPGNVRELENLIYRSAVIAQGDTILLKDLPPEVREAAGAALASAAVAAPVATPAGSGTPFVTLPQTAPVTPPQPADRSAVIAPPAPVSGVVSEPQTVTSALDFLHTELSRETEPLLERLEREMITRAFRALDGNLARTAERLGMTRATLRKRVEELGLQQS
jgi:two-component system nitrogen regulation response regulator GlnG